MFEWYFKGYFIENSFVFWIGIIITIVIILLTVYLVYKELKRSKNANK